LIKRLCISVGQFNIGGLKSFSFFGQSIVQVR
jgi:hypothetical protein